MTLSMYAKIGLIIISIWVTNICRAQQADSGCLEQANDFTYILASGEQQTLYAIQAEMVLLYFYDPTCEDCHLLMSQLEASDIVNSLIDEKKLTVLAVYPDDDMETWNEYAGHIPPQWINGYDKGVKIHTEGIFLIKSFPTLYLLDKDKMIRMKEMTFEELEGVLSIETSPLPLSKGDRNETSP